MLSRFFQESDHLLALYAGESLEELLDRITRLQMIEQLFTGTRVPVKTGSPPRISGSCDTTLLTLARIPHCSDRKIDVLPRLIPQLSTIGHQPSIISRLRCMRLHCGSSGCVSRSCSRRHWQSAWQLALN